MPAGAGDFLRWEWLPALTRWVPSVTSTRVTDASHSQAGASDRDWLTADCPACGNTFRIRRAALNQVTGCPVCGMSFLAELEVPGNEAPATRPLDDAALERPAREEEAPGEPAPDEPLVGRRRKDRSRKARGNRSPGPYAPADDFAAGGVPTEEVPAVFAGKALGAANQPVEWHQPVPEPSPEPGTYEVDESTGLPVGRAVLLDDEFKQKLKQIEGDEAPGSRRRRRRRRFLGAAKELVAWDFDPRAWKRGERTGGRFMIVSVSLLCLAAFTLAVVIFTAASRTSTRKAVGPDAADTLLASDQMPSDERGVRNLILRDPGGAIEKFKPIVKDFLDARNWKERLAYCRDPERVGPLMEAYYANQPDGPVPYRSIGTSGNIAYRGNFAVLGVELADYEIRQLALHLAGGKAMVDWESFVGYCDVDPAEFRKARSTESRAMRATITKTEPPYLNYGFRDEDNLDCYTLTFPDQSYVFGYAERFSKASARLQDWMVGSNACRAIVKLAYPQNAPAADQVWIKDAAEEGWVVGVALTFEGEGL